MLTAHRWYLSLPLFIPFTTSGSIFSIVNVRIASRVRSLETIDEVLQWGTTLAFSIMTLLVSIHLLLFLFSHVIAVPGVHIFNQQNNGQVRGWPGFGCMPYCNGNPRGSGGGSRGRESNPDPVASNEPQPSGPRSDDSDESQISIFNQQNNMNCWSGNCGYPSQDGEGGSSGRGSNGGGPSGRGSSVYGPRGRGSSGCGSRGCGSSGDGSYGGGGASSGGESRAGGSQDGWSGGGWNGGGWRGGGWSGGGWSGGYSQTAPSGGNSGCRMNCGMGCYTLCG